MAQISTKLIEPLLKGLADRQKAVLIGRFGLGPSGEKETLEAIGKKFDITRERVRQIEASALSVVATSVRGSATAQAILKEGKHVLQLGGGVMRKDVFIETLSKGFDGLNANHFGLLLAASKAFYFRAEDDNLYPFYYLDKEYSKKAEAFLGQWISFLKSRKTAILEGKYDEELKNFVKEKKISPAHAEQYEMLSKRIHRNSFGDIGLAEWPEVKPKTIRDRIYVVLKKEKKPVHFEDIARLINQARLDTRLAIASTVHNELIKDERFVLIGRGLYGLSEHGYEPGTAVEVIARILKKQGPMKSPEIIQAVQKERFFKHNTILVNLQNKNLFQRGDDGVYKIREA